MLCSGTTYNLQTRIKLGMGLSVKNIRNPLINAFLSQLRFYGNSRMKSWRQTQTEIARIRLLRSTAQFCASLQIVSNSLFER
ncbi:hypothetical protein EMIT093MI4_70264 [Pseudomonas sp. IT-93MI4]